MAKTLTEIMQMLDNGHTITLKRHWNSDTIGIAIEHKPHGPCTMHTGLDNFYGLEWDYQYDRLARFSKSKEGDKILIALEDLVSEFMSKAADYCLQKNQQGGK